MNVHCTFIVTVVHSCVLCLFIFCLFCSFSVFIASALVKQLKSAYWCGPYNISYLWHNNITCSRAQCLRRQNFGVAVLLVSDVRVYFMPCRCHWSTITIDHSSLSLSLVQLPPSFSSCIWTHCLRFFSSDLLSLVSWVALLLCSIAEVSIIVFAWQSCHSSQLHTCI